jgi:hypothetical protein
MADQNDYRAIVEKIYSHGPHGPYAVTSCDKLGSVTFSLDAVVWQESDRPEPGTYVILSQVRKKRAGWRAQKARFLEPADETTANSIQKEQSA